MENNEKLVKVYSNNSKKARIKRNKNKFQRVWDTEKQTYVKVRKAKYPAKITSKRADWREKDEATALKRRQETPKVAKVKPIVAEKTAPTVKKQPARINGKTTSASPVAKIYKIHGMNYTWDSKELCYKKAA